MAGAAGAAATPENRKLPKKEHDLFRSIVKFYEIKQVRVRVLMDARSSLLLMEWIHGIEFESTTGECSHTRHSVTSIPICVRACINTEH